jgi:16S rRNA (uracil1498-N3)-methyltransferase
MSKESEIDTVVIGCEGGLTDAEIKLFDPEKIVGLDTPLILRSESAVVAAASKLLL